MRDISTTAVYRLSDKLGLRRPAYDRETRPDLWRCWADRVLQLGVIRQDGRPEGAAVADLTRYDGHPQASRVGPAPLPWGSGASPAPDADASGPRP